MKILKLLVDMPDYNLKAGNLVLSTTMKDDSHYDIWINDKIVVLNTRLPALRL